VNILITKPPGLVFGRPVSTLQSQAHTPFVKLINTSRLLTGARIWFW